jgi:hypothetical protein
MTQLNKLKKLKDTQLYIHYFNKKSMSGFDSVYYWSNAGFLEYKSSKYNKEEHYKFLSNIMCRVMEYDIFDISEIIFPIIVRASNMIYNRVGVIDLDIEKMINNIHKKLDSLLSFYEVNFPNIDWQAECCANFSSEIALGIINLRKNKLERITKK